jgi:2-desacetyl-2-hydroxyethyl bacteriochlorophyllide A dehydrogenase
MRAAVFKDHRFDVAELPTPQPGPGQVLVKVRACGICGSDLHFAKHADHIVEQARKLGAPTAELERGLTTGLVLGHEFVGEIVDFGPETSQTLQRGDRVCSMPFVLKEAGPALLGSTPETPGAYAEYLVLSEALCLKVDNSIPDEAAALVEPLGIAVHAVNKAAMQAGDVAVVVGCGPIGLAITAVLKMRGVHTIVASDLSPRRRDLAQTMGATQVINGREASAVLTAAAAAPGARMVVFENTGAPGMLGRLVLEAPQNARIVVSGIAAGDESFIPMVAIMKELQLSFIIYYSPQEFAEALAAIRDGKLNWQPLVTGTIGLDEVNAAFKSLEDPEVHAKILIDPRRPALV